MRQPTPNPSCAAINSIVVAQSSKKINQADFDMKAFNKTLRLGAAFEADKQSLYARDERIKRSIERSHIPIDPYAECAKCGRFNYSHAADVDAPPDHAFKKR